MTTLLLIILSGIQSCSVFEFHSCFFFCVLKFTCAHKIKVCSTETYVVNERANKRSSQSMTQGFHLQTNGITSGVMVTGTLLQGTHYWSIQWRRRDGNFRKVLYMYTRSRSNRQRANICERNCWLCVCALCNQTVNDFGAKESARYSQLFVVTELVVSGTWCTWNAISQVQTKKLGCLEICVCLFWFLLQRIYYLHQKFVSDYFSYKFLQKNPLFWLF